MQQKAEKGKESIKISHETLKKQLKLKLQQQHESQWKADTGSSSKLNFYGEIKEKYTFEKYLDFIDNRQHKAALTKLRISAHRLHIETGRYNRYDYNLRRYVNTPQEERNVHAQFVLMKLKKNTIFFLNVRKIRS